MSKFNDFGVLVEREPQKWPELIHQDTTSLRGRIPRRNAVNRLEASMNILDKTRAFRDTGPSVHRSIGLDEGGSEFLH